jgi:hypothetical protein
MRKTLLGASCIAMIAVSLSGQAQAWSLRTRFDPNDHEARTDIRRVRSDLSASMLFLGIASWQRVRAGSIAYTVWLDTRGSSDYDREIHINPGSGKLLCVVDSAATGRSIGERHARRSNHRTVACVVPRGWFGRIRRAVRFHVMDMTQDLPDRAPNRGEYRWL